eukprot:g20831.t1
MCNKGAGEDKHYCDMAVVAVVLKIKKKYGQGIRGLCRATVDIWVPATIIQGLRAAMLRPDVVHQLEDAQECSGIPSERTTARMEFHIGPRIPPMLLIFGHPVRRGVGRLEDLLVGLLLGLAINKSRQWTMEGVIMADCLPIFHAYVCARVSLGKEHD